MSAAHQCCGKCEKPARDDKTAHAIGVLTAAVKADPDYAWGWHCNIAMSAVDAGCPHQVANEGAARFMNLLFGVDTRAHPGFPKPAVDATEPRHAAPADDQQSLDAIILRQQESIMHGDAIIRILLQKLGGRAVLRPHELANIAGYHVESDNDADGNFVMTLAENPPVVVQ